MSPDHFSDRTVQMITDFGENRFPRNFRDWKGIGAVSKKGLDAQGIVEPVQLLGHFLMLKKDPVPFEALLAKAGVVATAAQSIRAQLQEWCLIHDVRNATECKAQADLATDDTATGVVGEPDNSWRPSKNSNIERIE
jgi:hypothetical protein